MGLEGHKDQIKSQDILDIPLGLANEEAKRNHIIANIIPRMNQRRDRLGPLSEEAISNKLWSPPASEKAGEHHELVQAIHDSQDVLITEAMALEIADVIYYSLQPNAPKDTQENLDLSLFLILGDMGLPYDFCILKYEARLRFGDLTNHREIEEQIMQKFFELKKLPNSLIKSN